MPERDGVLSGLIVAEAVSHYALPLSDIIRRMEEEFGALHYDRRDLHRPMPQCARLIERVRSGAVLTDDRGRRFLAEGSVRVRSTGTRPSGRWWTSPAH